MAVTPAPNINELSNEIYARSRDILSSIPESEVTLAQIRAASRQAYDEYIQSEVLGNPNSSPEFIADHIKNQDVVGNAVSDKLMGDFGIDEFGYRKTPSSSSESYKEADYEDTDDSAPDSVRFNPDGSVTEVPNDSGGDGNGGSNKPPNSGDQNLSSGNEPDGSNQLNSLLDEAPDSVSLGPDGKVVQKYNNPEGPWRVDLDEATKNPNVSTQIRTNQPVSMGFTDPESGLEYKYTPEEARQIAREKGSNNITSGDIIAYKNQQEAIQKAKQNSSSSSNPSNTPSQNTSHTTPQSSSGSPASPQTLPAVGGRISGMVQGISNAGKSVTGALQKTAGVTQKIANVAEDPAKAARDLAIEQAKRLLLQPIVSSVVSAILSALPWIIAGVFILTLVFGVFVGTANAIYCQPDLGDRLVRVVVDPALGPENVRAIEQACGIKSNQCGGTAGLTTTDGSVIAGIEGVATLASKSNCTELNAFARTISVSESVQGNNPNVPGPEGVYYWRFPSKSFGPNTFGGRHPDICERIPWNGKCSTAAGRYQFLYSTWRSSAERAGVNPNEFTPANQDKAVFALLDQIGVKDILCGSGGTDEEKMERAFAKAHGTWTSLPGGKEENDKTRQLRSAYIQLLEEERSPGTISKVKNPQSLIKIVKNFAGGVTVQAVGESSPPVNYSGLSQSHRDFLKYIAEQKGYPAYPDKGGVDPAAQKAIDALKAKAKADGFVLEDSSTYRGYDKQVETFFRFQNSGITNPQYYKDQLPIPSAVPKEVIDQYLLRTKSSAPPGYSQHHTGRAVDFTSPDYPKSTELDRDTYPERLTTWLNANAPSHGFKLSYPPGNTNGADYEPWHWVYEGIPGSDQFPPPAETLEQMAGRLSDPSTQSAVSDPCIGGDGSSTQVNIGQPCTAGSSTKCLTAEDLKGWRIIFTSCYYRNSGAYHGGVDYVIFDSSNNSSVPLPSLVAGRVVLVDWNPRGYGNSVSIQTATGEYYVFAHMKENYMKEGDIVTVGQVLGIQGTTGSSSGIHVHFGVSNTPRHPKGREYGQRPVSNIAKEVSQSLGFDVTYNTPCNGG